MPSRSLAELRETAKETLEKYTSTSNWYAFNTYDVLGDPSEPLSPADVLMANLLSLKLSAAEVIPLFTEGLEDAQKLRAALDHALETFKDAPAFESFSDIESLEACVAPLAAANTASIAMPKWTAVTVSKVLHRRAPQIVPIIDSRVRSFYGVRYAEDVRSALWHDIRNEIDWLAPLAASQMTPDGRALSVLRLADILIWMAEAK